MILITGSTGPFGSSAINFLMKKGVPAKDISALARNEEKASGLKKTGVKVIIGNYDDYDSLVNAFKGIEKLLFVSGSEIEKRDRQHENIIRAAGEASVEYIVYTSFDRKNDNEDSPIGLITRTHIETENKIRKSGINYTFLRNALYAEGLPMFLGKDVLKNGIYLPAGNGKVPFASRTDMAEVAAKILSSGKEHYGKSYKTVNTKNYSFNDIAGILSEITGSQIKYVSPAPEEFTSNLTHAGVPKEAIAGIVGWIEGIKQGYFESENSDFEMLLGRKPYDLKAILEKVYLKD